MTQNQPTRSVIPISRSVLEHTMPIFLEYSKDGSVYIDVCGTAIVIDHGIAITAKHVIDGYFDRLKMQKILPSDASIYLFGGSKIGSPTKQLANGKIRIFRKDMRIFPIEKIEMLENADVAVLKLFDRNPTTGDAIIFPNSMITTDSDPIIGETLYCLGYPNTKLIEVNDAVDGLGDEILLEATLSTGEVIDKSQYRYNENFTASYYRGKFYSEGGMSGGPIFDSEWTLTGVLSSSMKFSEDEYESYFFTLDCLKKSIFVTFDPIVK